MDTHHPNNLDDFVAGNLDEAETNHIIEHIGQCDHCLQRVDTLWAATSPSTSDTVPDLDTTTARRLESRLFRQLHVSELAGRSVWLGTSGLLDTYLTMLPGAMKTGLAMLRPLFMMGETSKFSNKDLRK